MATNCEADSFVLLVRDSSPLVRQSRYLLPLTAHASHSTEQTTVDVPPPPPVISSVMEISNIRWFICQEKTDPPTPPLAPGTPPSSLGH